MLTASQKRKENIAEYLLYMWQIEDLIRSQGLDLDRIEASLIEPRHLPDDERRRMREWYESLIDMMRREEVVEHGHLQLNKNVILQLVRLHNQLLNDSRMTDYQAEFYKALPYIVELRAHAGDNPVGEIETCFNALYGLLMLRLSHREVSKATQEAMSHISRFVAILAHYFKLDEEGRLYLPDGKPNLRELARLHRPLHPEDTPSQDIPS